MGKITQDVVARFQSQSEAEAAVAGLPPGFIAGLKPTLSEGRLTINAGVANVAGHAVYSTSYEITFEDWIAHQIGGFLYYVYLTSTGFFKVDNREPVYSETQFYLIHPGAGYRYICQFFLNTDKVVQYANVDPRDEVAAQNLTYTKAVASLQNLTPEAGDVRSLMGMDPNSKQVPGTDPVQLLLQVFTGTKWSDSDKVVAGGLVSGAFVSKVGSRWIVNPTTTLTAAEVEIPPANGLVHTFDNTYDDQNGTDDWDVKTNLQFDAGDKKFGTHSLEDDGSNSTLTTAEDVPSATPMAVGLWWKSGIGQNVDIVQFNFGQIGLENYIRVSTDSDNVMSVESHDDDNSTDTAAVITTLEDETWYVIGIVFDYAGSKIHAVVNTVVKTIDAPAWDETSWEANGKIRFRMSGSDDTHIDDLLLVRDELIDPSVFVNHYTRDVAWNTDYAAADILIKPATGGVVRVVDAPLTANLKPAKTIVTGNTTLTAASSRHIVANPIAGALTITMPTDLASVDDEPFRIENRHYGGGLIANADCESATKPSINGETPADTGNVTWERSDAQSHGGTYSYVMSSDDGNVANQYLHDAGSDLHGLTAEKTYTYVVWSYVPTSGGPSAVGEIYPFVYDVTNTGMLGLSYPTVYDAWERHSITFTIPANCVDILTGVQALATVSADEIAYFDDMQFYEHFDVTVSGDIEAQKTYTLSTEGDAVELVSDGDKYLIKEEFSIA